MDFATRKQQQQQQQQQHRKHPGEIYSNGDKKSQRKIRITVILQRSFQRFPECMSWFFSRMPCLHPRLLSQVSLKYSSDYRAVKLDSR
ncbi:hypothetical protein VULLAG_LOCUS4920 [Vulpes lagopus]